MTQAVNLPTQQIEAILDGSLQALVVSAPPPEPSSRQLYLHSDNAIWARVDIKKIVEYTTPEQFAADAHLHLIQDTLTNVEAGMEASIPYGIFLGNRTLVIKPQVYTEINFQPKNDPVIITSNQDLYLCSDDSPLMALAFRLAAGRAALLGI